MAFPVKPNIDMHTKWTAAFQPATNAVAALLAVPDGDVFAVMQALNEHSLVCFV